MARLMPKLERVQRGLGYSLLADKTKLHRASRGSSYMFCASWAHTWAKGTLVAGPCSPVRLASGRTDRSAKRSERALRLTPATRQIDA